MWWLWKTRNHKSLISKPGAVNLNEVILHLQLSPLHQLRPHGLAEEQHLVAPTLRLCDVEAVAQQRVDELVEYPKDESSCLLCPLVAYYSAFLLILCPIPTTNTAATAGSSSSRSSSSSTSSATDKRLKGCSSSLAEDIIVLRSSDCSATAAVWDSLRSAFLDLLFRILALARLASSFRSIGSSGTHSRRRGFLDRLREAGWSLRVRRCWDY